MFRNNKILILLLLAFSSASFLVAVDAEARIGRGRSSGRSSFQRSAPARSAPQSYPSNNYNSPRNSYPPSQPPAAPRSGGFMRGLAGGVAGGFLGSMLFSSLGRGAGGMGPVIPGAPMVGGGGEGGGIGLLEIILLAGIAYFGFRWWKNRQLHMQYAGTTPSFPNSNFENSRHTMIDAEPLRLAPDVSEPISSEEASDIFFQMQGAWTRRDLQPVQKLVSADFMPTLAQDLEELKRSGHINRLENISIRGAEILGTRAEGTTDLATVRFTANVLDYTVDEASGRVIDGSDSVPVKFDEEWVFAKPKGARQWQLAGIQQS